MMEELVFVCALVFSAMRYLNEMFTIELLEYI